MAANRAEHFPGSAIIGIDLGTRRLGRVAWARYRPGPAPGCFEAAGEMPWHHDAVRHLLREQRGVKYEAGLLVVEVPDPPRAAGGGRRGYGQSRAGDHAANLLELAGIVDEMARGLKLPCLLAEVSSIRQWAAALDLSQYRPKFTCPYCGSTGRGSPCRLCGGNGSIFNFNWNQPDKAIKDWFLARGASRHSVAAEGPLSNRDKRDAMLAACFGESQR